VLGGDAEGKASSACGNGGQIRGAPGTGCRAPATTGNTAQDRPMRLG
jgi:hypothetical protein